MKLNKKHLLLAMALAQSVSANDADLGMDLDYHVKAFPVAEINLSNGNTVKIMSAPEVGNLSIGESTPANGHEQFVLDSIPGSPLEQFLQLTPKNTPIPQVLIESEINELAKALEIDTDTPLPTEDFNKGQLVSSYDHLLGKDISSAIEKRGLVIELKEPVSYDVSHLGFDANLLDKAAGQGSCNNSTGYQYFEENHCGTSDWKGYGKSEGYCYYPMHQSIQKTSSKAMRYTWTRTAACGSGNGRVRHSRNQAGGFSTHLDYTISPNSVATWRSTKSGWPWKRRTHADKLSGNGYVRHWVKYYKQLTQ